MAPCRFTRIEDLSLGDDAVWNDGEVNVGCQYLRGAPSGIDDASLKATLEGYPVPRLIWLGEIQNQSREKVAQSACSARPSLIAMTPEAAQYAGYRHIEYAINYGDDAADAD